MHFTDKNDEVKINYEKTIAFNDVLKCTIITMLDELNGLSSDGVRLYN